MTSYRGGYIGHVALRRGGRSVSLALRGPEMSPYLDEVRLKKVYVRDFARCVWMCIEKMVGNARVVKFMTICKMCSKCDSSSWRGFSFLRSFPHATNDSLGECRNELRICLGKVVYLQSIKTLDEMCCSSENSSQERARVRD